MKTAISIPDDLFRQADAFAEKQGWSRSELYARAVTELLRRERESRLTASFDDAYAGASDERDAWGDLADFRRAARGAASRRRR